ncbi:hypothetical protein Pst134EA_032215 [Puccinia striiformis f. sp. tritici]|uniref:uncharacterized protein n=1 Tax=Puccinia striiformis f. sp. tritici TaxID=168172 RepID=UPI0020085040|nr:uncharacterized protein Pst134EA_032215 [Puccinia striiformis f. sp. tritici]KAH9441814.1 hypothetical protein Pst134EA_032215 [Puccinia striiformis f. sp. tritici]
MSEEDDDVFPRFGSLYLDDDDSTNFRRSLTDLDDPQDNSSSLEQEKADAEKGWEQFVASTPDEDLDSYPDSFAQDVDSNSSCSDEATDSTDASKTSSNLAASASTQSRCRGTQAKQIRPPVPRKKGSPRLPATSWKIPLSKMKPMQLRENKPKSINKEGVTDKEKNAQADKEKNAQTDEGKNAEADQEKKKQRKTRKGKRG